MIVHTWDWGGQDRNEAWEHNSQLGNDNQFFPHLYVSFTKDTCSTKTMPRKTLTRKAKLI